MLALRTRVASLAALLLLGACAEGSRVVSPGIADGVSARFNGGAVTGPAVVISQVYGGGGNVGASFNSDFVELFNRGDQPVNLSGMTLQYASNTGTGNLGANASQLVALTGTIQPGQYRLIQLAGGANGVDLPMPDQLRPAASAINMAGAAGKIALVNSTTGIGCNGGSTTCSTQQTALLIDLVGFGNANFFEGSAAAPTLNNTTAAIRANGGCTDTNNNGSDFSTASPPTPRNSASAFRSCSATPPAVVTSVTITPTAAITVVGGSVALSECGTTDPRNGSLRRLSHVMPTTML